MCNPMAFMIASTAFSAMQSIQKGEQEEDFQNYQAEQASADAQAEREAGEVRATKVRKASKSTKSEATAALAASGVEVSAGTPVRIEGQIVRNAEEDALNEILYGERKGRRLEQSAQEHRAASERASTAGYMGAVGSVLSGGSQMVGSGWKTAAQGSYKYAGDGTVRIA